MCYLSVINAELGAMVHNLISALGRLNRQISEFKAQLIYIESSRSARAIQ